MCCPAPRKRAIRAAPRRRSRGISGTPPDAAWPHEAADVRKSRADRPLATGSGIFRVFQCQQRSERLSEDAGSIGNDDLRIGRGAAMLRVII
jgi:hypothetical protein